MIIDEIKNIYMYKGIIPANIIEDITLNISGEAKEGVTKNVLKYTTASDKPFEQHQIYNDLHVVLSGEEYFGMTHASGFEETETYHADDDYSLGEAKNDDYLLSKLTCGQFVVFSKGEAHRVGWSHNDIPNEVYKIVYKYK